MNNREMNQTQQTIQDGDHIDRHQKEATHRTQKVQVKEKARAQEESD